MLINTTCLSWSGPEPKPLIAPAGLVLARAPTYSAQERRRTPIRRRLGTYRPLMDGPALKIEFEWSVIPAILMLPSMQLK